MINIIIIFALAVLVLVLAITCLKLKADNDWINRKNELYKQESDRNIERMAKDVLRDDIEILSRWQ